MVLIPKGGGGYRGIGLVEVVQKLVAAILNRRLTASITYHNFLHEFRAGCSKFTDGGMKLALLGMSQANL